MIRLDSALSWWHEEVAKRVRKPRPIEVRHFTNGDHWAWTCRECHTGAGGYLYRDDAIHFGVYHLRAHQPMTEETA